MNGFFEEKESFGTQRRRSRSEVPKDSRPEPEPEKESPPADPQGSKTYPEGEFYPDENSADSVMMEAVTDDSDPEFAEDPPEDQEPVVSIPKLGGWSSGKGRRLVKKERAKRPAISAEQRLLILDTWKRSGLPAGDFASLVGVSKHTLYEWKRRFEDHGPAGLMDRPRGARAGSKLPELTKRTILMLKEANPDWGCQRISDMLARGPALPASPTAVARVLKEAGYELEEVPTRPHPQKFERFERAKPNQLWQTDLFTFVLKRQNRRVYLVAFLDDYSRFVVGYGLHASQSSALVLEVLRSAIASYQSPEEILTDNGSQYVTWRGKSAFSKELGKRGIRQIVAAPRRPQTLGKIERFWGTMWRECIETAVFLDLGDAQRRIGHFIDHYNFQRPHQGIDGLVPADRFFGAAPEVLGTLKARVAANAAELARNGVPKNPFYVTGQVGGKPFSVHAEGERVIMTQPEAEREEVELVRPDQLNNESCDIGDSKGSRALEKMPEPLAPEGIVSSDRTVGNERLPMPGTSPLEQGLRRLADSLEGSSSTDEKRGEGGSE